MQTIVSHRYDKMIGMTTPNEIPDPPGTVTFPVTLSAQQWIEAHAYNISQRWMTEDDSWSTWHGKIAAAVLRSLVAHEDDLSERLAADEATRARELGKQLVAADVDEPGTIDIVVSVPIGEAKALADVAEPWTTGHYKHPAARAHARFAREVHATLRTDVEPEVGDYAEPAKGPGTRHEIRYLSDTAVMLRDEQGFDYRISRSRFDESYKVVE